MRERVGCRKVSRGMKQFIKFLDTNELVDLRMFGAQFTWKNHNKLDRFLISTDFDAHYPSISAHVLGRPMSDHSPINLSCEQQNWGPSPFRFQAMCLHNTNLLELMKDWWESYSFSGSASFILAKKFQTLKENIKAWNIDVFGKVDRQIESILAELPTLDSMTDNGSITDLQTERKVQIQHDFEVLADRRNMMYLQKSGNSWNLDGDRNTKFYHKIVKMRRRRNTIHSLKVNGQLSKDKDLIKSSITKYLSSLFAKTTSPKPSIVGMKFKTRNSAISSGLESEILESDCLAALKGLGQDKAPGPDGFQVAIILKCWHFMGCKHNESFNKGDFKLETQKHLFIPDS